nr:unnamed protein product [Callosobruchus chinensis]
MPAPDQTNKPKTFNKSASFLKQKQIVNWSPHIGNNVEQMDESQLSVVSSSPLENHVLDLPGAVPLLSIFESVLVGEVLVTLPESEGEVFLRNTSIALPRACGSTSDPLFSSHITFPGRILPENPEVGNAATDSRRLLPKRDEGSLEMVTTECLRPPADCCEAILVSSDSNGSGNPLQYVSRIEQHLRGLERGRTSRRDCHGIHGVQVAKLKRGEIFGKEKNGIVVFKWRHKRDVIMLSTKHTDEMVEIPSRDGARFKPKAVIDYNKAKSFIDLSDQMSSYSTSLRRNIKWLKKMPLNLFLEQVWSMPINCSSYTKTMPAK